MKARVRCPWGTLGISSTSKDILYTLELSILPTIPINILYVPKKISILELPTPRDT